MELQTIDRLDPVRLGKQLQQARLRCDMTQQEAAKLLDVSRTTITAIEKGERRVKAMELIKLAKGYGIDVSMLVRERPEIESFEIQFRSLLAPTNEELNKVRQSIDELQELCRDYLELERIMNAPLLRNYPEEYNIGGMPVGRAAEHVAVQERTRLGLGDGPIDPLRTILETDVGIRIFFLELHPSSFSELYHYDHELGACMAINVLHPEQRRRWSMVHGYGHFLVDRYKPEVVAIAQNRRKSKSERFADYYGLFFQMPTSGLVRHFMKVKADGNEFQVSDLFTMAHIWRVAPQALCLRLEELQLLPSGTWDKLIQRGLKVEEAQRKLDLPPIPARTERLPLRYRHLAIEAYDQGEITEAQFARFLRVDRLESRDAAMELRKHSSGIEDRAWGSVNLLISSRGRVAAR